MAQKVLVIVPKIRNTYPNQRAQAHYTWRQQMNTATQTVEIDLNDAAFLAVLVTQYIAKGNNTDHLQKLVAHLTPKAGC